MLPLSKLLLLEFLDLILPFLMLPTFPPCLFCVKCGKRERCPLPVPGTQLRAGPPSEGKGFTAEGPGKLAKGQSSIEKPQLS